MKTMEVLQNIRGNGGFDNFRHWSKKEVAEWVYNNYDVSKYVANKVASYLV